MKYLINILLFSAVLFSNIVQAGDFSMEIETPYRTITATSCDDIAGLHWIEPFDSHFGSIIAQPCDNVITDYGTNTSPVAGNHSLTATVYDGVTYTQFFECALIETYRNFNGPMNIVVFCQDDVNPRRKRSRD